MIYFVQNSGDGLIKIGTTKNVNKRIQNIQASVPYPLKLLCITDGGREEEAKLHKKFNTIKVSGEWFKPEDELMKHIQVNGGLTWNSGKFLQGRYFHIRDEDGKLERQGAVVSERGEHIVVQFFEWAFGQPTYQKLYEIKDAVNWDFYEDDYQMHWQFSVETGETPMNYREFERVKMLMGG